MRLLKISQTGDISLERFPTDAIPPYAILSHTWIEGEEVTFEDMSNGRWRDRRGAGYQKIVFCGEQARRHGLEYFWVDTCCIDKSIPAELKEAISSMFRWYQRSSKCYVYLSDVSTSKVSWGQAFLRSRWFKRGWTLQELLAPRTVEFFSEEGQPIGDKLSLSQTIHEATRIPIPALEGAPLSLYSVEDRLLWVQHRETKHKEDKAYSLLGLFGVSMLIIYGEGEAGAFKRLQEKIDKAKECIGALINNDIDPSKVKTRIKNSNGDLLVDSYRWILKHGDFEQWRDHRQSHVLWVKGDPGKGKTMLLCGIVDELSKPKAKAYSLSYFFCQASDFRINNATAVLRGLLYLLIKEQPWLASHIQKQREYTGNSLFDGPNAWVAVSELFVAVLQDPNLQDTVFIVDALDECTEGLPGLLDIISRNLSPSCSVKWLVSSRNWPNIERPLRRAGNSVQLCLELNAESVSAAVDVYIEHGARKLAQDKGYDDEMLEAVKDHLTLNAHSTFLWVAMVCQFLRQIDPWHVRTSLMEFPPGLDPLYKRMLDQVKQSRNANLCREILAMAAIAYRPLTLQELTILVEMPNNISQNPEWLTQIISHCGSFLVIRGDVIYVLHQSALDYLLDKASAFIFPFQKREAHHEAFKKSIDIMSHTLKRDMYGINNPGCPVEQVETPSPDPLAAARYSCVYWVDHLSNCDFSSAHQAYLLEGGLIETFLKGQYLYWLEALSLSKAMPHGVLAMAKLEALTQVSFETSKSIVPTHVAKRRLQSSTLYDLVHDAHRFIMYNKHVIETSPLQAYVSALIFSPTRSLIKGCFKKEEPGWVKIVPPMEENWSPCLQTLEGHNNSVTSVAFSSDSTRLASASWDETVRVWDTSSGECLRTLIGHNDSVTSVAFSSNSTRLASASQDKTVRIWDVNSGDCVVLKGHSDSINSVAFSYDSTRLASASWDKTVRIWDVNNHQDLRTLGHTSAVQSVAFSPDSTRLVSASGEAVLIWNISSGKCVQTLTGHSNIVKSVAFSPNSARVASASFDHTVRIWNASSGVCIKTLTSHSHLVYSVVFSHDSARVASASYDRTVRIWDADSGECQATLTDGAYIKSVAFSHDSARITSSSDRIVRIWDARSGDCVTALEIGKNISSISFDITGLYLHTNVGMFATDATVALGVESRSRNEREAPQYQDVGLSSDGEWITSNAEQVAWLPREYRPSCSAVSGTKIGAATIGSGKVWFCKLDSNLNRTT